MRRFKPSPAMGVALLALLVALGGSGFAASYVITKSSQIKDGAITGSDIKDSSLASGDIKNASLTGRDIKDGSLLANDFAAGQLPVGQQGQQGPQGLQGLKGETGPRGPSDLYSTYTPSMQAAAPGTSVGDVLELLTPPEGNYLWFGNAHVENNTSASVTLECQIAPSLLDSPEGSADWTSLTLSAGESRDLVLMGPEHIPNPLNDGLMLACDPPTPAPVSGHVLYSDIDLDALQVGTWH